MYVDVKTILSGESISAGATEMNAEFIDWIEPALGGWRYLLSPAYRAKTHEGWRHEHMGYVLLDVVGGVVGVAVSVACVGILVALVWRMVGA